MEDNKSQSQKIKLKIPNWNDGQLNFQKIPLKLTENEWTNRKNCVVCEQVFSTLKNIKEHHCRICGESVCQDCSTKQINSQRCCDMCFMKKCLRKEIRLIKNDLKAQDEHIFYRKNLLKDSNINYEQLNNDIKQFLLKDKDVEKQQRESLEKYQEDLKKSQQNLQKRCQSFKNLEESVSVDKKIFQQKQRSYEESLQFHSKLKLDIQIVKQKLEDKEQELQDIKFTCEEQQKKIQEYYNNNGNGNGFEQIQLNSENNSSQTKNLNNSQLQQQTQSQIKQYNMHSIQEEEEDYSLNRFSSQKKPPKKENKQLQQIIDLQNGKLEL